MKGRQWEEWYRVEDLNSTRKMNARYVEKGRGQDLVPSVSGSGSFESDGKF